MCACGRFGSACVVRPRVEDVVAFQSDPSPQAETGKFESCTATLVLDYDSLNCYMPAGHAGPHKGKGEQGPYYWQYA